MPDSTNFMPDPSNLLVVYFDDFIQNRDVEAFRRDEGLILTGIDYRVVPGLSNEARNKLEAARPRTVGQAGRIDGMTPAALGILAAYLRREARKGTAAAVG